MWSKNSDLHHFAGDNTVICYSKTIEILVKNLNEESKEYFSQIRLVQILEKLIKERESNIPTEIKRVETHIKSIDSLRLSNFSGFEEKKRTNK